MSIRTTVIAGCAVGFCTLIAGPAAMARTHTPASAPNLLHQRLVGALLRAGGIRSISSGHCARRANPHCTSFEGLRAATFSGLLALKQASHCHLTVSGGTEAGHAAGRFSHHTGYKLDVLPNRCLDGYIPRHFQRVATRADGAAQYRGPGRVTLAREGSHWDMTFGAAPGSPIGHKGVKPPADRGELRPGIGQGEDKPMTGRDDELPIGGPDDDALTGDGAEKSGSGKAVPTAGSGKTVPAAGSGKTVPTTGSGKTVPATGDSKVVPAAGTGTGTGTGKTVPATGSDRTGTGSGDAKAAPRTGKEEGPGTRHGAHSHRLRHGAPPSVGAPRAAEDRTGHRHADVGTGWFDPEDDDDD
ncbi:hypothetical protein GCM10029978_001780 [Actinoallomurus acanthiterrae]